jgi:hypothetical protein
MVRKGEGGRGPTFFLMLAFMCFALYSGIVAWQTLDDCENPRSWHDWNIYPPGWDC